MTIRLLFEYGTKYQYVCPLCMKTNCLSDLPKFKNYFSCIFCNEVFQILKNDHVVIATIEHVTGGTSDNTQ